MKYPTLPEQNTTRQVIDVFRGYNHNLRISDGEFYDMQNMTSDYYPLLSPRRKRGTFAAPTALTGMIAKDKLCYVSGADFVKAEMQNGQLVEQRVAMQLNAEKKSLISMGAYVIIMPDKKWVNTNDLTHGDIEASITTSTEVSFALCRIDGEEYSVTYKQATEPSNPMDGAYWIDTSSVPNSLKQYSSTSDMWVAIASTYIKISALNIGKYFNVYDGVDISGIEDSKLSDLNGSVIIYDRDDGYIVVQGILDEAITQTSAITVSRTMPIMDFIIESGNRLWGCRYGTDKKGNTVNEIYASKLGDFKNWNCFLGISTDSYVASLGTNGEFTGAITHLGYPIFFKEGCMHKVYGDYPPYRIQDTPCRGVQKGSEKSLAIVNEVLYYKSRHGICAYDGSLPNEISSALGENDYFNAIAGSYGNKYYISMADNNEKYHLFVYDALKGMWHREDNTQVMDFCSFKNEMYYIDNSYGQIKTIFGSGTEEGNNIEWNVETGVIGFDSPDKKYISHISVRLSMEFGARVYFFIQYDSSGTWEHISTMGGKNLRTLNVPIRPHRCDHFRLRISGYGYSKIYSITKSMEVGSDV